MCNCPLYRFSEAVLATTNFIFTVRIIHSHTPSSRSSLTDHGKQHTLFISDFATWSLRQLDFWEHLCWSISNITLEKRWNWPVFKKSLCRTKKKRKEKKRKKSLWPFTFLFLLQFWTKTWYVPTNLIMVNNLIRYFYHSMLPPTYWR